jgi:nicotinate-nucleotide adenylyltransferase
MKIGIFGGTFDPIHNGHLIIAEIVRSDLPLDRILFIPSAQPPHKTGKPISPFKHRMQMLEWAVGGDPQYGVSDIENRLEEPSYSVHTVQALKHEQPDDEFFFIIGGDSLAELHTWYQPEKLLSMIRIIVANRPDFDLSCVRSDWLESVHIIKTPLIDISSTNLRERVKREQSIRFQVPDSVLTYIEQKGLYQ